MPPAEVFDILSSPLEKAKIRYAIGGSWASTAFGQPRFTNNVDILAEVTPENLAVFLHNLPETFYADPDEALNAILHGRPFNVIHMPTVLKFDLGSFHCVPNRPSRIGPRCFIWRIPGYRKVPRGL